MVHVVSFWPRLALKLHTKCEISVTVSALEMRWWALRRNIHCYLSFIRPSLYIYEWLEELQIAYRSPLWFSTCCATSTDNNSHISWNISDFRYLLSTWNGTLCCKERHALLLECVMTFLKYIKWIWRALYSIYKPSIVHIMFFLPITNIKLHAKYQH